MQKLTSLSPEGATSAELQERIDASLVYASSAEPLNAMPVKAKLGRHWRREIHPAIEQEGGNPQGAPAPVPPQKGLSAQFLSTNKFGSFLGCSL